MRSELAESEDFFRLLANELPQIVFTAGPDERADYFNRRWYDYTGLPETPDSFDRWAEVVHPDDLARVMEAARVASETKTQFEAEYRIRRHDGEYRWHLGRATTIRDAHGNPLKRIGTSTDIHEKKRREEEQIFLAKAGTLLAASLDTSATLRSLTELAIEHLADGCTIDLKRGVNEWERVAIAHRDPERAKLMSELVTKYPPAIHTSGKRFEALAQGRGVLLRVDASMLDEFSSGRPEGFRELFEKINVLEFMICPLIASGKEIGRMLLLGTDRLRRGRSFDASDLAMTEDLCKRAAIALENARLFEEAEKAVHARDSLISVASHELLTPVTSLKLQVELMQGKLRRGDTEALRPERVGRVLEQIERQVSRLHRLVSDMLDLSRIHFGKFTLQVSPVDLTALVKSIVDQLRPRVEEAGCRLNVSLPTEIYGQWDESRLEQVLTNLLLNAVRYAPGTPITISAARVADRACLTVKDCGPGIAVKDHERIFQRFERGLGPRDGAGLGLGLYIVRQIAEAHGGYAWVESELGKGAAFHVLLPRAGGTLSRG